MFETTIKDGGEVRVGERRVISFPYTGDIKSIVSAKGCNCASVRHNKAERSIDLEYTPSGIPRHLREQGHYRPKKAYDITVDLEDGGRETYRLTFTAIVRQ